MHERREIELLTLQEAIQGIRGEILQLKNEYRTTEASKQNLEVNIDQLNQELLEKTSVALQLKETLAKTEANELKLTKENEALIRANKNSSTLEEKFVTINNSIKSLTNQFQEQNNEFCQWKDEFLVQQTVLFKRLEVPKCADTLEEHDDATNK